MRIGIDGRYIQNHFPGIGRYTYSLVRALGDIDRDNEYVVYFDPRQQNDRYNLLNLTNNRVSLRPVHASPFSLMEQVALPIIARRDGLDLFHSPYYLKPYILPCPSVVTIHDAIGARFPQYFPSSRARLAFGLAMRLALATSRMVIVPSRAALNELALFFRVRTDRVAVIYYGADDLFPEQDTIKAQMFDYAGENGVYGFRKPILSGCCPSFLLFVGTNKPHKNLVRLVRAYAQASVEPHLIIVGREDPRFPEVRHEVEALGLQDRVHFLGEVDDETLRQLYGSALALVFPSLDEGFGLPALEAMACGTPVVCSRAGSLPEVVGEAALTFEPENVEDIAAALRSIVRDSSLQTRLSKRGRERARRFSWKQTALATIDVYKQAIGGRA